MIVGGTVPEVVLIKEISDWMPSSEMDGVQVTLVSEKMICIRVTCPGETGTEKLICFDRETWSEYEIESADDGIAHYGLYVKRYNEDLFITQYGEVGGTCPTKGDIIRIYPDYTKKIVCSEYDNLTGNFGKCVYDTVKGKLICGSQCGGRMVYIVDRELNILRVLTTSYLDGKSRCKLDFGVLDDKTLVFVACDPNAPQVRIYKVNVDDLYSEDINYIDDVPSYEELLVDNNLSCGCWINPQVIGDKLWVTLKIGDTQYKRIYDLNTNQFIKDLTYINSQGYGILDLYNKYVYYFDESTTIHVLDSEGNEVASIDCPYTGNWKTYYMYFMARWDPDTHVLRVFGIGEDGRIPYPLVDMSTWKAKAVDYATMDGIVHDFYMLVNRLLSTYDIPNKTPSTITLKDVYERLPKPDTKTGVMILPKWTWG